MGAGPLPWFATLPGSRLTGDRRATKAHLLLNSNPVLLTAYGVTSVIYC